ncbi:hypothetical protein AMJ57_04065 [Parcubacteria bacterium SG8_24]|nr:MAG: hypothetical protein AMJ57_04065 [Parcubacteria bacterium SG8_24]
MEPLIQTLVAAAPTAAALSLPTFLLSLYLVLSVRRRRRLRLEARRRARILVSKIRMGSISRDLKVRGAVPSQVIELRRLVRRDGLALSELGTSERDLRMRQSRAQENPDDIRRQSALIDYLMKDMGHLTGGRPPPDGPTGPILMTAYSDPSNASPEEGRMVKEPSDGDAGIPGEEEEIIVIVVDQEDDDDDGEVLCVMHLGDGPDETPAADPPDETRRPAVRREALPTEIREMEDGQLHALLDSGFAKLIRE